VAVAALGAGLFITMHDSLAKKDDNTLAVIFIRVCLFSGTISTDILKVIAL